MKLPSGRTLTAQPRLKRLLVRRRCSRPSKSPPARSRPSARSAGAERFLGLHGPDGRGLSEETPRGDPRQLNAREESEGWLAQRPLVTFHRTPTRASWLDQVEGWFRSCKASRWRFLVRLMQRLQERVNDFIQTYNDDAEPFVWTKSKVHPRRVRGRRLKDL